MRLRYVALVGPQATRAALFHAAEREHGLVQALSGTTMELWVDRDAPVLVAPDQKAALVGLLYERDSGERLTRLPCPERSDFVERFWGAYVLFLADGNGGHVALRDPSGSVRVYHRTLDGMDLYASDLETLQLASHIDAQPDTEFIRHWLAFPFLRTERTGILGVTEVLPGTCRSRRAGQSGTQMVWDPWRDALAKPIESFEVAAALLREEALACIPRLALEGENLVVQLSGGLDSSIVAAALGQAKQPFRAVTFATEAPDGDERRYAQMLAERYGFDLVEIEEPTAVAPDFGSRAGKSLRPRPNALLEPLNQALAAHFERSGAQLVFGGAGGDNVFASLSSASPVLDAFAQLRFGAGLAAVRDLAELHGCTFWKIAKAALRKARKGHANAWRRDTRFLAPGAAADHPDPHPWLSAQPGSLPGKREHVASIVGIHHFLNDSNDTASGAFIQPILAQPIVELCLRIPTFLWVTGGRDRAVARAAFRGLIPDAILARRSKGRLESMFRKGYKAGREQLEEHLLEGRLRGLGIVDPEVVSAYIREPGGPSDAGYIRLLEIAAAESWLRSFDR